MVFKSSKKFDFVYWQFITFILPWIWWRAYSVLDIQNQDEIKLIIKRIKDGRLWSKFICDSQISDVLKWVWPAWHFTLKETNKNKLFIWTWTWFVPLFNQINWSIKKQIDCKLKLIFWTKTKEDIFYIDELNKLKLDNPNFDFEYYISREQVQNYNYWRVTDYLTKENISDFEEFYICWIPQMIDSSIEILTSFWVSRESIFTEKY
jgi:NAD(P)H-flavin reductase